MVVLWPDDFGDSFSDLSEERMADIREQQTNCKGAPGDQRARHPIRLEVEFFRPLQDAFTRGRTDAAFVAQSLGDGHYGDI